MSITTEQKKTVVQEFRAHAKDTGSTAIQIALLSEKIENLANHLKNAPKDYTSRLGLFKMVSERRRLLKYLKNLDTASYQRLITRLELRK